MAFGIQVKDKTMKEILKTLDRIVDNPDDLALDYGNRNYCHKHEQK